MSQQALEQLIESLASEVVMSDPHDLQAAMRIMELFGRIGESASGELAGLLAPACRAAVSLAEEMIVQPPEEAVGTMELLGRTVTAFQRALEDGATAGRAGLPPELLAGMAAGEAAAVPPAEVVAADDKILAEFLSRQDSVLEDIEEQILAAEKQGFRGKPLAELKRVLHTLKGETGMLGLGEIQRVCHEAESFIEKGAAGMDTAGAVDVMLGVKDWLAQSFKALAGADEPPVPAADLLALFFAPEAEEPAQEAPAAEPELLSEKPAAAETAPAPAPPAAESLLRELKVNEGDEPLFWDFINEAQGHLDNADVQLLTVENDPEDPDALNAVFRSFHTIKGVAGFLDLKDIQALSHVAEDALDRARKGRLTMSGVAIDLIFESVDVLRKLVGSVERALASREPYLLEPTLPRLVVKLRDLLEGRPVSRDKGPVEVEPGKKLGEILVESGRLPADRLNRVLLEKDSRTMLGEALVKQHELPGKEVAEALRAQKQARTAAGAQVKVKETIKIDTERLDKLLDTIGELVIAESMVSQSEEILALVSAEAARNLNHLTRSPGWCRNWA